MPGKQAAAYGPRLAGPLRAHALPVMETLRDGRRTATLVADPAAPFRAGRSWTVRHGASES